MNFVDFWSNLRSKIGSYIHYAIGIPLIVVVSIWSYITYEFIQWDLQRDLKQKEAIRKIEDLSTLYTSQKLSFDRELKVMEESIERKKSEYTSLQEKISAQNALIDTQEEKIKVISDLNNSIVEKTNTQKKLLEEIQTLEKEKISKDILLNALNEQISKLTQEEKSIVEAHQKALALKPIVEQLEREFKEISLNTESAKKARTAITSDMDNKKNSIALSFSIEEKQKELDSTISKVKSAQANLDLIKENSAKQQSLLNNKITEMTAREAELKGKVNLLTEQLKTIEEKTAKYANSISEKQAKESDLLSSISAAETKLSNLNLNISTQLKNFEDAKKSYESDINKLREEFLNDSKNLASLQATFEGLSKSIASSNQSLDLTNKNIAANKAIIAEQNAQIETLKLKVKSIEATIGQKRDELNQITKEEENK